MQATQQRIFSQQPSKQRPGNDEQVVQVVQDSDLGRDRDVASSVDGGIPLSQSSVAEEYCPTHSDLYVAFDKKKNELVCNQCIYNEVEDVQKALEQLTFTSYVASNLKELFDEKFSAYKNSLQDMNKIAPKVISQTLETTVNKFFESIDSQINEVEQGVLNKIQGSTNLRELEQLLCREKEGFGLELEKLYEQSRQEIENYVQKGCYSSVVSKKDTYEDMIGKMRGNNERMQKTVEEGQRKIERIMTIKQQHETDSTIGKRLHDIVDSCLEIDLSQANQAYKRQRVESSEDLQRQQLQQQQERQRQQQAAEEQRQKVAAEERRKAEEAENQRKMQQQQQEAAAAAIRAQKEAEERARAEEERRRQQAEALEQQRRQQEAAVEQQRQLMEQQRLEQERLQKQRADEELKRKLEADAERQRQEAEVQRQQQLQQQQQELARKQEMERQQEIQRQQQLADQQKAREAAEAAEKQRQLQEEANRLQMQQLLQKQKSESDNLMASYHSVTDAQQNAVTATSHLVARGFLDRSMHNRQRADEQQPEQAERQSEEIVIHDSTVSDAVHEITAPIVSQEYQHQSMSIDAPAEQMVEIVDTHSRDDDHHQMIELNQQPVAQAPISAHMVQVQQVVDQHIPDMQQMVQTSQNMNSAPVVQEIQQQPAQQQQQPQVIEVSPEQVQQPIQQVQPEPQKQAGPLITGPNTYNSFMKQSANRVTRCVPDENLSFRKEIEQGTMLDSFMYRVVSLPSGKAFVIGGAKDVHGAQPLKTTYEIVNGQCEERAQMWIARSAFGLAVYPNFSQVFIAGGKINENEATKHCERYIVAQNVWKRLPELREPKFNTTLCFFNNGGTLYCFGGLTQQGSSQLQPSSSIERLSKGQNSWQLLELKLPKACFDMGALQITSSEILVFGGFEQGARQDAYLYSTGPDDGSFKETKGLETADFFEQNGVYIKLVTDSVDHNKFVFNGHTHNHLFDQATMEFKTLPMQ